MRIVSGVISWCGVLAVLSMLTVESRADSSGKASVDKIAGIEGVYKKSVTSAVVDPGGGQDKEYVVEDIVEIVRFDDSHVYLRAKLNFYNGHSCSIYGIATYENNAFVYRHSDENSAETCALSVASNGEFLLLTDRSGPDAPSTCKSYCGARGSLTDFKIEMSKRRPIRYMNIIKASREYAAAVDELNQPKENK
jgi:hypothetical protein